MQLDPEKIIKITTVTPVYSGKEYLPELVSRLEGIRNSWKESGAPVELTESIFVNDSSSDGSLEVLQGLARECSWVRIVNLSINFGQHPATVAGILHSSGDWVVTLDEDLQHEPEHIDAMLQTAIEHQSDIVYASPEEAVHQSVVRDWASRGFKKMVVALTGNTHVSDYNSFRLMRGTIARAAASVCAHETYYDNAICWFTSRIESKKIPMKDARFIQSGKSGYTLRKLFSHSRRMIMSSDTKVLRIGAIFGFIVMAFSVVFGINIVIQKIFSPHLIEATGWTSLIVVLLFFGGLLSLMVGIALEYITAIMLHFQGKPTFFVVDRTSDSILQNHYSRIQSSDHSETK